jgi:hypothetical protein
LPFHLLALPLARPLDTFPVFLMFSPLKNMGNFFYSFVQPTPNPYSNKGYSVHQVLNSHTL